MTADSTRSPTTGSSRPAPAPARPPHSICVELASGRRTVAADRLSAGFTARERLHLAGKGEPSWAARALAKRAIDDLLLRQFDMQSPDLEILPVRRGQCRDPRLCTLGHPLVAVPVRRVDRYLQGLGCSLGVSISHHRGTLAALAFLAPGGLSAAAEA